MQQPIPRHPPIAAVSQTRTWIYNQLASQQETNRGPRWVDGWVDDPAPPFFFLLRVRGRGAVATNERTQSNWDDEWAVPGRCRCFDGTETSFWNSSGSLGRPNNLLTSLVSLPVVAVHTVHIYKNAGIAKEGTHRQLF